MFILGTYHHYWASLPHLQTECTIVLQSTGHTHVYAYTYAHTHHTHIHSHVITYLTTHSLQCWCLLILVPFLQDDSGWPLVERSLTNNKQLENLTLPLLHYLFDTTFPTRYLRWCKVLDIIPHYTLHHLLTIIRRTSIYTCHHYVISACHCKGTPHCLYEPNYILAWCHATRELTFWWLTSYLDACQMYMYTAAAHKEWRTYNTVTVSMQTLIGARNCNTNDALTLDQACSNWKTRKGCGKDVAVQISAHSPHWIVLVMVLIRI